ncbi:MAG: urease accessory protein UreF [Candidatus Thiodiazotropha sp.]|jgi:urease accessory protein
MNTDLRLMHLVSPSLPVGAFTYSQGLEWAVECGWVRDRDSLRDWIADLLATGVCRLDVPVLARLYQASREDDHQAQVLWSDTLIAYRETRELRDEERNRGRALASLLPHLGVPVSDALMPILRGCQLAGFAHAAAHWSIPLQQAARGYVWSWLENMVLAGVKIIPLGQTAGQGMLAELTEAIPPAVETGLSLDDEAIGASCLAQAMASSRHETQYTRIYRS